MHVKTTHNSDINLGNTEFTSHAHFTRVRCSPHALIYSPVTILVITCKYSKSYRNRMLNRLYEYQHISTSEILIYIHDMFKFLLLSSFCFLVKEFILYARKQVKPSFIKIWKFSTLKPFWHEIVCTIIMTLFVTNN